MMGLRGKLTGGRAVVAAAILAFAAGLLVRGGGAPEHAEHQSGAPGAATDPVAQVWTCSMHPQIRLPGPGKCPICFMDLIPAANGSASAQAGPRELSLSAEAVALLRLETAPVERRFVEKQVRTVGMVVLDETRVAYITARVPGRLDRMFVDYAGVPVRKGDHLVSLYSPELLGAQEELLQAAEAARKMAGSEVERMREMAASTVVAAREKLRLWGLTAAQIEALERRGTASDHVTMYAPSAGTVVHKGAREGMYVETGTPIYTIADLTHLWVELDAYESDLPWVRYGHDVEFTVEAYPGEVFRGTVAFIPPVLDEASRTVKVRVNVANPEQRLKPGMFVRAQIRARVAEGGRIMSPKLAGKWISPMHPEVVKDGPGTCDVCGMPLVRAEELGYADAGPANAPLVIPATAPLLTGTRAVVYVEVPGRREPTYEGREIVLGARAGDYYLVREGLAAGERVVVRGAFKLDAELQIRAQPSMMSPAGGAPPGGHGAHGARPGAPGSTGAPPATAMPPTAAGHRAGHTGTAQAPESPAANRTGKGVDPAFAGQLAPVVARYLEIQTALAGDDGGRAIGLAEPALQALAGVDMVLVKGDDHVAWMGHAAALEEALTALGEAGDLDAARARFGSLSDEMAALVRRFGAPAGDLYLAHCPMAFEGRGASWLQDHREIDNPFFGAAMLRCGSIEEVLE